MIVIMPTPLPLASPTPLPSFPTPVVAPDQVLNLASDGVSSPPGFTLAGGDYDISWVAARPAPDRECTFDAMLMSDASVSPFTLRTLGPRIMTADTPISGNVRLSGLGPGGYTLRSTGTCRWTATIRPLLVR